MSRSLAIPSTGFRNIAVLRLSSLGDVVLATAEVATLRRTFPEARIVFWVKEEYADVLRFDSRLSHVRILERDARRVEDLVSMSAELEDVDLIVDLHGNLRTRLLTFRQKAPVLRAPSARWRRERWVHARWTRPAAAPHALERYARALAPIGLTAVDRPTVEIGPESAAWAEAWLREWAPSEAPIALCPGARHFTKRWPESHWLDLHARLRDRGHSLLYFSLEAERRGMTTLMTRVTEDPGARWCTESLARMAALLSRCRLAVTSDSGLMHLAAACGLRVVAMFGSTAPELGFAPAGEGHAVLCRHEPCQPCTLHGREACPKKHFRCMVELPAERVAESVASHL